MSRILRRYEIMLPLRFNDGGRVPDDLVAETLLELEQHFGAVSSETMIGADGPAMDVPVSLSRAWQGRLAARGKHVPSPIAVRVLIDTGSDLSVVHPQILRQLGVSATGSVQIRRPVRGLDSTVPGSVTYMGSLERPRKDVKRRQFVEERGELVGRQIVKM